MSKIKEEINKAFNVLLKLERDNNLAVNQILELMEARITLQLALKVLCEIEVIPDEENK